MKFIKINIFLVSISIVASGLMHGAATTTTTPTTPTATTSHPDWLGGRLIEDYSPIGQQQQEAAEHARQIRAHISKFTAYEMERRYNIQIVNTTQETVRAQYKNPNNEILELEINANSTATMQDSFLLDELYRISLNIYLKSVPGILYGKTYVGQADQTKISTQLLTIKNNLQMYNQEADILIYVSKDIKGSLQTAIKFRPASFFGFVFIFSNSRGSELINALDIKLGAVTKTLCIAVQQHCPILVSEHILQNMLWARKSLDTLNKTGKTEWANIPQNVKSLTGDPENWRRDEELLYGCINKLTSYYDIYRTGNNDLPIDIPYAQPYNLVLLLPKQMDVDTQEGAFSTTQNITSARIAAPSSIPFNMNIFARVPPDYCTNPVDPIPNLVRAHEKLVSNIRWRSLFSPTRTDLNTCVYLVGHGSSDKANPLVANMTPDLYSSFLTSLSLINCKFYFMSSCYAGGKLTLAHEMSAIQNKDETFHMEQRDFYIAVASVTDIPASFVSTINFSKFFRSISQYLKRDIVEKGKESDLYQILSLLTGNLPQNRVSIKWPHDLVFRILTNPEEDGKINEIKQLAKRREPNKEFQVFKFNNISDITIYSPRVDIPIEIKNNQKFHGITRFTSMIESKAFHLIDSLSMPSTSFEDVILGFLYNIGRSMKAYVIKKLVCDCTKIQFLPGDLPADSTIDNLIIVPDGNPTADPWDLQLVSIFFSIGTQHYMFKLDSQSQSFQLLRRLAQPEHISSKTFEKDIKQYFNAFSSMSPIAVNNINAYFRNPIKDLDIDKILEYVTTSEKSQNPTVTYDDQFIKDVLVKARSLEFRKSIRDYGKPALKILSLPPVPTISVSMIQNYFLNLVIQAAPTPEALGNALGWIGIDSTTATGMLSQFINEARGYLNP